MFTSPTNASARGRWGFSLTRQGNKSENAPAQVLQGGREELCELRSFASCQGRKGKNGVPKEEDSEKIVFLVPEEVVYIHGRSYSTLNWSWGENILDYFLNAKQIKTRDGAEVIWYHRANSKIQMAEAIKSAAHMIEADVLLCEGGGSSEPIMAHPPETSSDNTLKEWLNEIKNTNKGIKLDFKSLAAVQASVGLLGSIKLRQPVWLNADILPGPNGSDCVVEPKGFLDTVTSFFPDATLSLGWTTGWISLKCNKGYSSEIVQEMEAICKHLTQPVTFPVRAALVRQSVSELQWLLQQSNRYTLTIWTGKHDDYSVEDLLFIRDSFDKSRVFYDILEPQNSEFRKAIGM